MKFIYLLSAYFKKLRLHSFVMMILMAFSMFLWVENMAVIRYILYDYRIVKTSVEEAYYTEAFVSRDDMWRISRGEATELSAKLDEVSKMPGVDHIYGVYTVNPVKYKSGSFSVTLVDPKMVKDFPALKEIGLDFSNNAAGCVLVGTYFDDVKDSIDLSYMKAGGSKESVAVIRHIRSAYKQLSLNEASSIPLARDLFADVDAAIIMLATPENIEHFSKVAVVQQSTNYILVFSDMASEDEREDALDVISRICNVISLREITENTRLEIYSKLKELLPRPAFLLLASTVSYLSIVILFVRKKKSELAVSFLCGASKIRLSILTVCATVVVAAVPALINIAVVVAAERMRFTGPFFPDSIFIIDIGSMMFGKSAFVMIIAYFILTIVISLFVVLFSGAGLSIAERLRAGG